MKSRQPRCIKQQLLRDWRALQYQIANPYSSRSHYFPQPTNRIDSSSPSPPCYCSHLIKAGTAVWTILCLRLAVRSTPNFSNQKMPNIIRTRWSLVGFRSLGLSRVAYCSLVSLTQELKSRCSLQLVELTGQQNGIVRVIMIPRPLTKTESNTVM